MNWREILFALLALYFLCKWLGLKQRTFDALLALDKIPSPHFMVSLAVNSLVGEPWRWPFLDGREQARATRIRLEDKARRHEEGWEKWSRPPSEAAPSSPAGATKEVRKR